MTHARIKSLPVLCQQLIGQSLGTNQHGQAGRALENLLQSWGWPINRGSGPDILIFGLELKTRDLDADSAQTVTSMNLPVILRTPYEDSVVRQKFQQQLRVFTRSGVIVDAGIFDFGRDSIQTMVREAYEHGRSQLIDAVHRGQDLPRTKYRGGYYGFFERTDADRPNTYSFRLSKGDMIIIEDISRTRIDEFYSFV
jgi:hypothetical protein